MTVSGNNGGPPPRGLLRSQHTRFVPERDGSSAGHGA
jgi:hypothetical protein